MSLKRISQFILIFYSFQVWADFEEYYHIKIPQSQKSCEQEATDLARRFSAQGKPVTSQAKCSGAFTIRQNKVDYRFYGLEIKYTLKFEDLPSRIHSSYYGHGLLGNKTVFNDEGMYSDLNLCLKELPSRIKEYASYTQHPVLAATCERGTSAIRSSFTVRIDTVGKPAIDLASIEDFSEHYNEAPFNLAVQNMIESTGGHIVAHKDGYFYYYSQQVVEPQSQQFGSMRKSDCKEQIDDLRGILQMHKATETTVGCSHRTYGMETFAHLDGLWNHFHLFHMETQPETYSFFSECDRDKSRVIDSKKNLGQDFHFGICRYNSFTRNEEEAIYSLDLY